MYMAKSVVALLCLVGLATSDFAWRQGKEYIYTARGRLMTQLTTTSNQVSGIEIEQMIKIVPVSEQKIAIKPVAVKVLETQQRVPEGWVQGELNQGKQVQLNQEVEQYLKSPVIAHLRQGVISSIQVEQGLPTWALNMKKSLVSHFIMDTTGANVIEEGNLNREGNNAIRGQEQSGEQGYFYKVLEESVHGKCQVYYTISQVGPFESTYEQDSSNMNMPEGLQNDMNDEDRYPYSSYGNKARTHHFYEHAHQYGPNRMEIEQIQQADSQYGNGDGWRHSWALAYDKLCQGNEQVYQITKTVNFTSCERKPVLAFVAPAELNECRPGDNSCGAILNRAMTTDFLACGQNRQQYTILKVIQNEMINYGIGKVQKMQVGAMFNTTLVAIKPASGSINLQNAETVSDLTYTFEKQGEYNYDNAAGVPGGYPYYMEQFRGQAGQAGQEDYPYSEEQQQYGHQGKHAGRFMRNLDSENQERYGKYNNEGQQQEEGSQYSKQGSQYSQQEYYGRQSYGQGKLQFPSLKRAPLNPLLISKLSEQGFEKRVHKLLEQAEQSIQAVPQEKSLAESEVTAILTTVAKLIRFMSHDQIMSVYQQVAQSSGNGNYGHDNTQVVMKKDLLLDAMSIAGTCPSTLAVVRLIENGQVKGEKAAQQVMTWPAYIKTPTPQLIEELFNFLKSNAVQRQEQVKTTAILAFSTLLKQACVDARIKQSRYPVALYGEFCTPQDTQKFVEYFAEKLERDLAENKGYMATVYLAALGNIGHPRVVPVVQKVLDQVESPVIRTKAIYALQNVVISRGSENAGRNGGFINNVDRISEELITENFVKKHVLPILMSVTFEKSEHPMVRMAAIQMLTYCSAADVTVYQQLALSTWAEPLKEIQTFIWSTLKHLSKLDEPLTHGHFEMKKKALTVVSLCKKVEEGAAKSQNYFMSGYSYPLTAGFFQQFSWYGAADSTIPAGIYYRSYNQFGFDGLGTNPVEFSATTRSLKQVYEKVVEKLANVFEGQNREQYGSAPEIEEIKNVLGIHTRQERGTEEGTLYFNIRNEFQRMFEISVPKIEKLLEESVVPLMSSGKSGMPIHYQKFMKLVQQEMEFPTCMGIPAGYSVHVPVILSVLGNARIAQGGSRPEVVAKLSAAISYNIHEKVSFKAPFVGIEHEVGVKRQFGVDLPIVLGLAKPVNKPITVTVSFGHGKTAQGKINLMTYEQYPYVAMIRDDLLPISFPEAGKIQAITTQSNKMYHNEKQFGEKTLGMSFILKERSDYRAEEESKSGWSHFVQKMHTPGCLFNIGTLGTNVRKFAQRKLIVDMSQSETKTLVFLLAAKEKYSAVRSWSTDDSEYGMGYGYGQEQQQEQQEQQQQQMEKMQQEQEQQQQEEQEHHRYSKYRSQAYGRFYPHHQPNGRFAPATRTMVLAVIGKPTNLEQVKSVYELVYGQQGQCTVQHMAQYSYEQGKFIAQIVSGKAVAEAAGIIPTIGSESVHAIKQVLMQGAGRQNQKSMCFQLNGKMELPQFAQSAIVATRKVMLQQDLRVPVAATLVLGEQCNEQYAIKIEGELSRDRAQSEYAQRLSDEARRCEHDEQKGFEVSPVCLKVAREQAGALNKINLKIRYNELPLQFVNATKHLEQFAIHLFYPVMSYNQLSAQSYNGQGKTMKLGFTMSPDQQFWSLEAVTPTYRVSFEDVKSNGIAKVLLPLTVTETVAQNIRNRVLLDDAQPSCTIQRNHVATFDNVTYGFSRSAAATQGCYHIAVQECSNRRLPVSVAVKNPGQEGAMAVQVILPHQVKVNMHAQQQGQVTVNGQQQPLPYIVKRQNTVVAVISEMPNQGIQLESRYVDVALDQDKLYIRASDALRNATCGMCGNFDGQQNKDLRSPKNIPLSSGSLLVASYAYSSSHGQCQVPQTLKQRIEFEEGVFRRQYDIMRQGHSSRNYYNADNDDSISIKRLHQYWMAIPSHMESSADHERSSWRPASMQQRHA